MKEQACILFKNQIPGIFNDFPGPFFFYKFKRPKWVKVNYCLNTESQQALQTLTDIDLKTDGGLNV